MAKKVTVSVDKALPYFDVWINGVLWTKESNRKGYVPDVEEGIGYLTWVGQGNPGTRFNITLKNAKKTFDGATTFERGIPKKLLIGAKTEQITV